MTSPASRDIEFSCTSHHVPGVGEVTFVTDANDDGAYARMIRGGWAPSPALRYCIETLTPGDTFVDVGANLGEFALPIAKLGITTLAIEALAGNVQLLTEGVQRNHVSRLTPVHSAAGEVTGSTRIAGYSAWGQVASAGAGPDVGEEVPAVRLDELVRAHGFERPRIVKIDVEGSERAVLRGLGELLALPGLELVIESNSLACRTYGHEYRALLEDIEGYGFRTYLFHDRVLASRTSADAQESCVADYLATRRTLEGSVGSFACRPLTVDESIALLRIDLEAEDAHRRHLSEYLERAPHEVLVHHAMPTIRRRLDQFRGSDEGSGSVRAEKQHLRIAWVVHQYGAEVGGGSETLCRALAELLSEDVDSTVLTTTARDYDPWAGFYPEGDETLDGVRVLRFPADQAPPDELRALYDEAHAQPKDAARGRRWLEALGPRAPGLIEHLRNHAEEYDALCALPYVFATTLAALETFTGPKLLVPCAHDEPAFGLDLYRAVFELADGFAFNTDEEAALVKQRFGMNGKPSRTIGFPIGPAPIAEPDAFRSRFVVEGPYLLCIGRVDLSKGTDLLLDLHQRTLAATPEHTLVLMGRQLMGVSEHPDVLVTGHVDEQTKTNAIAGAAAVVLPSPYESLSIVALEAWAQGIPVLVNADSPVLLGQVRRSGGGLWYRDEHDYRTMVGLLLASPELGRGLGEAGRAWVAETYSVENIRFAWQSLLSELAVGSRAPA